ncbi:MAG: hypothetical protein JW807_12205 [Spirochaetes bacterium]|nr:hypothetical protein [Spirochaetota bacterium]
MILHRYQAEADEFVRQYSSRPNRRRALVEGLVRAGGRLQLNVPRYGIARLISERLKEGPFSAYYEFEKTLARLLHPLLADLNLNMVSDILVNRVFGEKYSKYARAVNRALAAGDGLSMEGLKDVILAMVQDDGHFMVVKFYDLVLRGAGRGLFRKAKPAELSIIEMKSGQGEAASDPERVRSMFREFRVHYGDDAADVLRTRMEWDPELRGLVAVDEPLLAEPEGAVPVEMEEAGGAVPGGPENESAIMPGEAAEPEPESGQLGYDADVEREQGEPSSPWDSMIAKYAVVIKRDFLDKADDDDAEAVRQIVGGMFRKNARSFGNEEAEGIVSRVLAAWMADGTIGERKRRLLQVIQEERDRSGGEAPVEYSEPQENDVLDSAEGGGEEAVETATQNEMGTDEPAVTAEEMEALTGDHEAPFIAEGGDPGADDEAGHAAGGAGDEAFDTIALEMDGAAEEFLVSEKQSPGETGADGGDDGFLIEDLDLGEAEPATDSAAQPETDFVVQDEILFEDKTLRKKYDNKNENND